MTDDQNPLPAETPDPATPTPGSPTPPPANWVAFSPGGGIAAKLASLITAASKSIDVAMYTWTSPTLAQALIAARKRNVALRTILDAGEAKARDSQRTLLAKSANDVRLCSAYYLMHDKFAIIDGAILITGSYNWTQDAETHNAENLLCLYDQPVLVAAYAQTFARLWSQSKPA